MHIIVCVKRTPDTETRVRIAADGTSIEAGGVKYIVSPYDEFAVEAALRTREAAGDGEVSVVTLGDASSAEQLRACLAMGADRAVLLKGSVSMDGLATARALAVEVEIADAPLVLLGVKAADDDQQQVGPMLAVVLGRPCVTGVSGFELGDGKLLCHREVEGGVELVEVDLPAVVTVTKGDFEPRYSSLKGIMAAKRKPLVEKEAVLPEVRLVVESLEHPSDRPQGRVVGEGPEAVAALVKLLREEAKVL